MNLKFSSTVPSALARAILEKQLILSTRHGYRIMVTSFILLRAKRGKVKSLAENLAERAGIAEVYSVSGNFDLVAIARVKNNDALADLVTSELAEIEDITHSETMLAFRAFSRHDLQSMFSIGGS